MLHKTIPNILFLVGVNLLVKPFWLFGIDRVVQNQLGEATYGLYFALFNFSMFFQIINDFGIQNYNSRQVARDPNWLNAHFSSLITGKFLLSIAYMVVSLAVFSALGYSWSQYGSLFAILLLNQVLISAIAYLRSNLAGLHKFRLDAVFSVLDKALMILFVGSILYFNFLEIPLSIENFVLAQTAAFAINAVLLFATVAGVARLKAFRWEPALVRTVLKNSFPFALSIFLMSIYLRMDTIMIERLLKGDGAYSAGIYAQSLRIIDALNMIGILFANVLLPTYSRALADGKDVTALIRRATAIMAVIILPVTIFIAVFGQQIIELLYTNDPVSSGNVLTILIFSFAAYSFMHVFSSMLTAAGKLRLLNMIFGIGIALNFVSNLILIPKFGAAGAAITTSVSEWIVFGAIFMVSLRFLRARKLAVKNRQSQ